MICQGGYNLDSISKSALAVTRTLVGEVPDRMPRIQATDTGIETVQTVAMYQSRFWPFLYPKDAGQGDSSIQVVPSVLSIIVEDLFDSASAEQMDGRLQMSRKCSMRWYADTSQT